jgi:hypothetical protein
MEVVAIDKNSISSATKRWVQRLQAFIEVDLNQLFPRILDQSVDKVCIALGHGHMVRISSGWYFTIAQNDLRQFMDRCANGSGFTGWLVRHEGFKPV